MSYSVIGAVGTSWKKSAGFIGVLGVSALLAGCTGSGATTVAGHSPKSGEAKVVRVIDGDTFVASIDGREETVRLLNVDTPETKKPNVSVQCLGPEATNYLKGRLPGGTVVRLEYDVERTDRYQRTLAGVFQGTDFVNADIARAGFGVAVIFEPNRRFYDEVVSAQKSAVDAQAGLFDPAVDCTIPGQVETAIDELASLSPEAPATAAEATGLIAGAATAVAAGESAAALLEATDQAVQGVRGGVRSSVAAVLAPKLSKALKQVVAQKASLKLKRKSLAAQELKLSVQKKARAEAARRASADRKAAATRLAEAQAAREQAARDARREALRVRRDQETARLQAEQARTPKTQTKTAPRKSSNPYPGYTGPRCYAPGGKSWKPCP